MPWITGYGTQYCSPSLCSHKPSEPNKSLISHLPMLVDHVNGSMWTEYFCLWVLIHGWHRVHIPSPSTLPQSSRHRSRGTAQETVLQLSQFTERQTEANQNCWHFVLECYTSDMSLCPFYISNWLVGSMPMKLLCVAPRPISVCLLIQIKSTSLKPVACCP